MGNYLMSDVKSLLSGQRVNEHCLPVTPYVKFPNDLIPAGENGLVADIHILPERLQRCTDDGTWYWWSDAQFLPFNDSSLLASTSAFIPRALFKWQSVRSMPNGRILKYNASGSNKFQCQVYARTSSTVYPSVKPHPLGQLVCYCGTGEVVVMSLDGDPVFQRGRDISNAVHTFCAVAKNGVSFACLKRAPYNFFLETFHLDTVMMGIDLVRCHVICPGFVPTRQSDSVQCKFSPDSKYITVSSSMGHLFTVKRYNLKKFCIICPDMVEQSLSASSAFDYSPLFPFQIISLATVERCVHAINLETSQILVTCQTEELVDCLHYSPDGSRLAMAFNNFDISIHDSQDLSCLQTIQMGSICEVDSNRVHTNCQAVLNLSFSQNSEYLASSTCDGHIRLWRIPRLFTLTELCRDVILTCLPVRRAKELKLPNSLKDFLMYKHF